MTKKTVKSVCPYCGVGCGILLDVVDNRIVKVSGDKSHPTNFGRLCTKGSTCGQPVATGGRADKAYARIEGSRDQGPIPIEAAIDRTASGLRAIIDAHGPDAVSFYVSGQMSLEAQYLATLNPFYRQTVWVDFILVFGSMALISWPPYARLVRAQVLSIRNRPYVMAAQALGLSNWLIILRYIVPNALGPLIVSVSAGLGTAMVLESAFSFLGVGVNPPTPSWGNMISDGLRVWQHYPHLLAAPAAVLGLASVAFSFLGDGLNDALNPRGSQ